MATVEFVLNSVPTIIQCTQDETIMSICQKFATKIQKNVSDIFFLYNGGPIDLQATFSEQASKADKENNHMKILAQALTDTMAPTEKILSKSKDIVCPECGELCFLHLRDHKVSLVGCKQGHKEENISLKDFEKTQMIDESTIVCQVCLSVDKSKAYNNQFFYCVTCKMNLCPMCNSTHAKEHVIVDYEKVNLICLKHNSNFEAYCQKCDHNLCLDCEKDHADHKENVIYFRDVFPKNEIVNGQLSELRGKIDTMNFKMNSIIEMFNKVMNDMELYYKFNEQVIQRYNQNVSRNYQLLKNINEIINYNSKLLGEMSIFKTNNFMNIIRVSTDFFSKMCKPQEGDYSENEIISLYQMRPGDRIIQIFGHEFIKNNKYNFDLYLGKQKYDLRDEFNFQEPKKQNEVLEIKIVSKSMITSFKGMFFNCNRLIGISPKSKWNTSHVTDMSFMFCGCSNLRELPDFSTWSTACVCDMSYMFRECELIDKIKNLNNFEMNNVTSISNLFYGCRNLSDIGDISEWNITNLIDMSHLFYDCIKLKSLPDITQWKINNLTDMSFLFNNCNNLVALPDISRWDTRTVNDIKNLFYNCTSLKRLPDISTWNIHNVNSLRCLFYNCKALNSLPRIDKWNTDNVTDMSYMFYGCLGIGSLPDISLWHTHNVENMSCMFNSMKSLAKLPDISVWSTINVKLMNYMFYDCVFLKSIPNIFKWNMSQVQSITRMFYRCAGLTTLPDINNWNIDHIKERLEIFKGCSTKLNIPPKYLG